MTPVLELVSPLLEVLEAGEFNKVPTIQLNVKKNNKRQKIGDVTKKHIEDNRKLLDDMKKEVKEKAYKEENS